MARELVRSYVNAKFSDEDRHLRRLQKVAAIETRYSSQQKLAGKSNAHD